MHLKRARMVISFVLHLNNMCPPLFRLPFIHSWCFDSEPEFSWKLLLLNFWYSPKARHTRQVIKNYIFKYVSKIHKKFRKFQLPYLTRRFYGLATFLHDDMVSLGWIGICSKLADINGPVVNFERRTSVTVFGRRNGSWNGSSQKYSRSI